ncbi:GtrA family protein [Alsobacter soli]|uniref:GtrA family protein n=1 Tax=Alsobacter soli TaxID=2109933 RepID=UPI001304F336|nr:GtrA family protein [Alsobacter soli]
MQETTVSAARSASFRSSEGLRRLAERIAGPRLARLLAHPLAQAFGRFLSVGVVGLATDASIFSVLDRAHMAPELSRALSLLAATGVTWTLNRCVTFGASGRKPLGEALRYALVAVLAQGFSYGVFLTLVYSAPALPRLVDLLVGASLAAFAGFAGHTFFAFAPARAPVLRSRSVP